VETAIRNAGRFMAEAGCDAIKLEGGAEMADRISESWRRASGNRHLGSLAERQRPGGFRVQGKGALQAKKIVDSAKALEQAGAFMILLEMVPDRLCKLITERAETALL